MSTTDTTTYEKSRGQYLQKAKTLQTASTDLSPLASDEVRVAIRSTTICGSDVHYYTHFCNGSIHVREPLCLGHEAAGEIVAVGSDVSQANPDLKAGDFVALECGVPCGQCGYCSNGRYNICPALRFRSSGSKFPHYQGTLQELVDHPARWVHRLPAELSFEVGALLEPLAVAIHAGRRAGKTSVSPRRTCLIFGAGAIGLLCAVAVRAEGCQDVIMVDIDKGRLDFALEHGFASVVYAVPLRKGQTLEEKLEIAKQTSTKIAGLRWPDGQAVGRLQTTFECTGVESCVQAGIYVSDQSPLTRRHSARFISCGPLELTQTFTLHRPLHQVVVLS